MTDWVRAPLSAVCSLVTDGTHHSPPNFSSGEYRYVTAKNVRPWGLDLADISFVDASTHREIYSRCPVEYGDVLYIKDGVTTGLAAINTLKEPFSLLSSVALLKPHREILEPRYLKHWLNSPDTKREMTSGMTGTAIKRLVLKQIRSAEIPLAPLPEQRRIADKLDTVLARVDSVNDRLARVVPLLKRFRQSVLAAAMSGRLTEEWRLQNPDSCCAADLIEELLRDHLLAGGHERGNAAEPTKEAHDLDAAGLPAGWKVASLRDCCLPGRPITYGILKPGPELDDGVPYVRVADFPGNRLKLAGIKKTSPEIDLQYKRARLIAGDLLLSIRGSVGRLIEIPAELDGANITQDTARLSINGRLNCRYMYFALLSPDSQRRMGNAVRGVAVRGINIGDVRALQVPLPSTQEQAEIVRRVEFLLGYAERLEERLQAAQTAAERLTPALLAKAFRGELAPQDPNDEPASELLKRLAAQREQGGAGSARPRGRRPAASIS